MRFLIGLLAVLSLSACGQNTTSDANTEEALRTKLEEAGVDSSSLADQPVDLAWEDLMPEGEEERLEALYTDFYDEFEKRMLSDQQSLIDAAEGEDMAALVTEGSANDTMEQIGTFNVVEDLDGVRVRLPGYVVPFDFSADAEHAEFLLVPYFGACLHTPPPPPNQMLFVKADPAAKIEDIYEPVWLEGTISTGRFDSDLGNSAYELTLSKIEPYAY